MKLLRRISNRVNGRYTRRSRPRSPRIVFMNPFLDHELYSELVRLMANVADDPHGEVLRRLSEIVSTQSPNSTRECLEEMLVREKGIVLASACSWCITSHPGTDLADRAVRVLVAELTNEAQEVRRFALFQLFFTNSMPTAAIPIIAPLLKTSDDDELVLWTAAAIYQISTVAEEFRDVARVAGIHLARALRGDKLSDFLVAAMAMGRQAIDREHVAAAVVRRFKEGGQEEKCAALVVLPKLGVFNDEMESMLREVILDSDAPFQLRFRAVHSLATMPTNDARVLSLLHAAIQIDEWEIARHAFAALLSRESYSPELITALAALLVAGDAEKRRVGALALSDLGSAAAWAAPIMISQLECEPEEPVCRAMIDALGAIGVPAIRPLIEAVRTSSLRALPLYQYALLAIGEAGIFEFARLIGDGDSRIRELAGYLLQSLGPKAAAATSILDDFIRGDDRDTCKSALFAVARVGAAGRDLAPAAAERLLDGDEELAWWAETALVGIGNDAIPHVERLLGTSADADGKCERLLKRLRSIGATATPAPANDIEGVTNDKHLMLFAVLGRLMADEGIRSLRAAAKRIEDLQTTKAVTSGLPASEGALRIAISDLERTLSSTRGTVVKLLARAERHKGGGLTPEGAAFLPKVERFLNFKLRLGDGETS